MSAITNIRKDKIMKIEEALTCISNAVDYWYMASEYEGKEQDEKEMDKAWTVIVKAIKKKGKA